ncbi:hypothetical protein [Streptomyces sp. NPDC046759]|uniref:hypothetical protein n=1 Tax=Streptomyces sp. NPDC046759 TaxID=3155019 RepID=UPI0033EF9C04
MRAQGDETPAAGSAGGVPTRPAQDIGEPARKEMRTLGAVLPERTVSGVRSCAYATVAVGLGPAARDRVRVAV